MFYTHSLKRYNPLFSPARHKNQKIKIWGGAGNRHSNLVMETNKNSPISTKLRQNCQNFAASLGSKGAQKSEV